MLRRIRNLLTRAPKATRGGDLPAPVPDAAALPAPAAEAPVPAAARVHPVTVHHGPRVAHEPIDPSDLDPDAVRILQRLTRFDHTAYLVGGCVRDLLLGRRPKDFDIATSATPRQVKRLFSNCRIIGRRFRLAHVYFQSGKIIEVATFRAVDAVDPDDAAGTESKDLLIRDDNVFGSAEQDALRRDFTINALFYDALSGNVLDHADGLADLRRHVVRTIGDPDVRFREDPIRSLRAIKFAARLDFEIEAHTLEALKRTRGEIPRAAPPRVLEEINRFCRGGAAARSFELALDTGVFEVILPEFAAGYRARPGTRDLMLALVAAIDRRLGDRHEASTGEILACLALPLLMEPLGWSSQGTATSPRGINFREIADELLRPVSLRLRVSRRDQERCRQIVQALGRMVPVRGLRRGLRQAILHRPAFVDAMWILDVLGAALGADFAEAVAYWRGGAGAAATGEAMSDETSSDEGMPDLESEEHGLEEEVAPAARKRRRRRRSRQRRKDAPAGAKPEQAAPPPAERSRPARAHSERRDAAKPHAEPAAKPSNLPPPWDDDYFFAALPTAPKLDQEDGDTDRYGAATVTRGQETEPDAPRDEAAPGAPPADGPPARKRRRRRRSRRGPASGERPAPA